MVRSRRLELPRDFSHIDLNDARIPIPPRPQHKQYNLRGKFNQRLNEANFINLFVFYDFFLIFAIKNPSQSFLWG